MFKWYVIVLLASIIGGWIAYPVTYPLIIDGVKRGSLAEIDWSKFEPGSLSPDTENSTRDGGSREEVMQTVAPEDNRFDAVVMIDGNQHQATGCIVMRQDNYYIVTSQHALAGNQKLTVSDGRGRALRGKKMLAAQTGDVVMIEIESPPEGIASMAIAQDVDGVTRAGDEILIAGDGRAIGIVELEAGKLMSVEPEVLEVEVRVYPGLRGAPLYHPKSRSLLGVLAESYEGSIDGNARGTIGGASVDPGAALSVRYFGQRLDTITQWEALDWQSFQAASTAAANAREELNQLACFVSGRPGYSALKDLKTAETQTNQMLANPSLSQRDREKAVEELLRIARSISSRNLNILKKSKIYYIHRQDMKELAAIAEKINTTITHAERNVEDFGRERGFRF